MLVIVSLVSGVCWYSERVGLVVMVLLWGFAWGGIIG